MKRFGMITEFEKFILGITRRGRTLIGRRLSHAVLAGSVFSFVAFGLISSYGLWNLQRTLDNSGRELGEAAAFYTGTVMHEQSMAEVRELVLIKAKHIETELENISKDTLALSANLTHILRNPEKYRPRTLPNPLNQAVYNGETYFFCNRSIGPTLSEEALAEAALVANIADAFEGRTKSLSNYTYMYYVGSEHGYAIRLELLGKPDEPVKLSEKFINGYDPRQRVWYIQGRNALRPVFSEIYTDTKGTPCITCAMPFYDNEGLAGVLGIDNNLNMLAEEVNDDIIGKMGFNFALNDSGQIIFSSKSTGSLSMMQKGVDVRAAAQKMQLMWFERQNSHGKGLVNAIDAMLAGERGIVSVNVDGEDYFLAFEPLGNMGWSFGMAVSQDELNQPAEITRNDILSNMGNFIAGLSHKFVLLSILSLGLLMMLLYLMFKFSDKVSERFVAPIDELKRGTDEISDGNLDRKLNIRTGDELEELADSFNAMTDDLKSYMENFTQLAAEREHIATELGVAKEIQEGILSRDFPNRPEFGLYATMETAKEVGGDFYDFYFTDQNHLMLTIADVSGKGVGAALFMLVSKTVMQNLAVSSAADGSNLSRLMARVNDRLAENNDAMMFVTAFIGQLELDTGRFIFVNGGHNPPLIYRADEGKYSYMKLEKNFVLGPMDGLAFKQQETKLNPGDRLFFYTDGVTEALNENAELFGESRLLNALNAESAASCDDENLIAAVKRAVAAHVNGAQRSDDLTMMSVTYRGVER